MVSTTGIVTIVDLVDIYSIHLALEEYRPGRGFKARMFVTHGTRFESSEVDIEKIRKPEGIEVRVDNSSEYRRSTWKLQTRKGRRESCLFR